MVMVGERSATCSEASGDGAVEGGWIGAAGGVGRKCVEVGPLQAVGEGGGGCGCPALQPSGALRGPLKVVVLR